MKITKFFILSALAGLAFFTACSDDDDMAPGNPVLEPKTTFSAALFGDSLAFTASVSDASVPLSTLKAQLYFGDEMVSETVIRTKTSADYNGKIFVPYYKNIPNATATLKLILQNIHFTIVEKTYDLAVSRPDFPYLNFIMEDGSKYRMERVGLYQYRVTDNFPQKAKGYIKADAMGTQGNPITFGWDNGAITQGVETSITFSNAQAGTYAIDFNTQTYVGSPFIKLQFAGTDMAMVNDDNYKVEKDFTQNQVIEVSGIADYDSWWIDADYFKKGADGKLTFLPVAGKYRVTANFAHKYFIVEAMTGSSVATLQEDGSGAVWIIGDNIGKPSLSNAVGWNTDKAICMAPIGGKKYQVTLVGGETVTENTINFKFFHQKGWGGEFKNTSLSTTSDLILVGDGENGRDPGNLGIVEGKTLAKGKTYVFTVDLSAGASAGVLTVVAK